jgi:uncharacterized protein (DUF305 family)
MRTRTRRLALAGLLAGTLVLAACGEGEDPTAANGSNDTGSSAEAAEANDQDRTFLQGMVPHHAQAVVMADVILDEDPSEPVQALAQRIKAAQQPEIEQMKGMLEDIGAGPAHGGAGGMAGGDDGMMDGDGGHGGMPDGGDGHSGMMSPEQMRQLRDATGAEAERLFLRFMIEHHQGAIEAADKQIADGIYRPAVALAETIRADQQAEIAEMEQLLTQL